MGMTAHQVNPNWRWFSALAALEAGAAFVALILLPREGPAISLTRASMLAFLFACMALACGLAYRPPAWLARLERPAVILTAFLLSLLLATALFLFRYLDPSALLPYYQRLQPVLLYLLILSLEACAFLLALRYGLHRGAFRARPRLRAPEMIAFGALLAVFLIVALTRIGLKPDSAYWGEPGVPLLGWQFALVLLGGLFVLLAGYRWRANPRIDIVVALCIWLLAVGIWLSVPASVTRNSFYAPITPPDNQPYPNSDAGYYDSMAESLLIGQPYQAEVPTRPLYIIFLTALHSLLGERYDWIIAGQTALLALIPVVLYFLGFTLHSRPAGVMVALAAIFREWTTIVVSSQTRVSDTRTLLVDLPTLLLLLLACLYSVRWLQRRDTRNALIAGGLFGLLLLLRTQSLLIAPLLVLVAIMVIGIRSRRWLAPVSLFVLALIATCLPWLLHNFRATGQLTFDAPFQYRIIASQYQYTGNLDINNVDLQGKSVAGILMTFLLRDPGFVFGFIATHLLATQIDGLLALPLFHNYPGLNAPLDLYWLHWDGRPDAANTLLLLLYLLVIAVGLGASWRRLGTAGLLPLLFSLGYSLANGIGRFSGWRYDLPADWVAYFYFLVGFAQVLVVGATALGAPVDKVPARGATASLANLPSYAVALPIAVFALFGALPWLAESFVPPRFTDQDPSRLVGQLASSPALAQSGYDSSRLEALLSSPSAFVQTGRLLYPRFFSRALGLASAHPWPAYAPRDFPRLGFLLLNQTRHDVVFPTKQLDGPFPQAADVIVLGCQREDYIEAAIVFFPASNRVYIGSSRDQSCE